MLMWVSMIINRMAHSLSLNRVVNLLSEHKLSFGGFIMKTLMFVLVVVLSVVLVGVFNLSATEKSKNASEADSYSKNLVNALKSSNDGLRQSALQMIIHNADKVNVDEAVQEIVNLYRYHKDLKVRQLALVALGSLNNENAIEALRQSVKTEDSPALRNQIYHILKEYDDNLAKAKRKAEEEARSTVAD